MADSKRVYLSPPCMNGSEIEYIQSAFRENRIAPLGANVDLFEEMLCAFTGSPFAVALSAGTAAIHLGLLWLGVRAGDRVFCSDVTFSASCNPIRYLGAEPVFIDSDEESWNMSPALLERALSEAKREGRLPKAVVVVDLYGCPADYARILPLCEEYGVPVLEDAAEALGASYRGRMCGTFGKVGVLSFNGNKLITTSGGGMALTQEKAAAEKIKFWSTQAREPAPHYEHKEIGYNYRLSNICAGIGCGQMKTVRENLARRAQIHAAYRKGFAGLPIAFSPELGGAEPNHWLTVIRFTAPGIAVRDVMEALEHENIESRPFWKPMHMQPVYADAPFYTESGTPLGERLFAAGLCLPSGMALTPEQQERIIGIVRDVAGRESR